MKDCATCGWSFESGRPLCRCEGGPGNGKRLIAPYDPGETLREMEMLVLLGIDEEKYTGR